MCGIMPHCIAPGCTSGYKSNPEKIHFFTVPKDENMITLWQNAIRRKDFVIRAGQFLCEKHFLPEDILWKRELTSPDGQVLGVSHYRQPRLRKGVIPSQFPWMEISTSVSLDNSLLQDTPFQETVYKFDALHCTRNNLQEARSDEPSKFSFINLITCATLQIPINWIRRTVTCEAITMESFTNDGVMASPDPGGGPPPDNDKRISATLKDFDSFCANVSDDHGSDKENIRLISSQLMPPPLIKGRKPSLPATSSASGKANIGKKKGKKEKNDAPKCDPSPNSRTSSIISMQSLSRSRSRSPVNIRDNQCLNPPSPLEDDGYEE
ncbi:PREDICTED: uncharacterized protein LOC108763310 [Trachymyrmex cornetzi]|uniref:uncharacterized protein LOC108763310 n=1 Tax=Trachymyrmex cornetzi TaxID=471704 RepID=UPI00084F3815|nr:PREDICTED: uncharacterized protein LOC108763310 [Trachymyrmex cornetzi]